MRNTAIFVVLLLFLAATGFFWFQALTIEDLPAVERPIPPTVTGAEAEAFISLAQELLIEYRGPLPSAFGRDPFILPVPSEPPKPEVEPSKTFVLSSIFYSDLHALAVINNQIIAEGDTIYDKQSGSEFIVQSIQVDKVEISDGAEEHTLVVASGRVR